jgi:predicted YcjX-like family ATPase
LVLAAIADQITRSVDMVTQTLTAPFSDPVIRLGVTGLSRAGKTVFITSLVANLMDRGRMPQMQAAANGAIRTAYLQPQPNDTLPRFEYEDHLRRLTSPTPSWPEGTRHISELRLSLRVQPTGLLSGLSGPRTVHLDIVDYPGEWLLDLGLLDVSFAQWSKLAIARATGRPGGDDFLNALSGIDATATLDEGDAQTLAKTYTAHLNASREAGFSDCTPGRFFFAR